MGQLAQVRKELKAHFLEQEYIMALKWGWPDIAEPYNCHLLIDWISSQVRDTMHSRRTYGFYGRIFLPFRDSTSADHMWGETIMGLIDYFELPAQARMADGRNWQVILVNRGGPPTPITGGERKSYRKDFYVSAEVVEGR